MQWLTQERCRSSASFFIGKAKESIPCKHLCLDVGKKEDKICHSPMIDKAK